MLTAMSGFNYVGFNSLKVILGSVRIANDSREREGRADSLG